MSVPTTYGFPYSDSCVSRFGEYIDTHAHSRICASFSLEFSSFWYRYVNDIRTRAEHRTGGPSVLSCPVGQDAFLFLSCPAARQDEDRKQDRAEQDKKCSSELNIGQAVLVFCPVGQDAFLVFVLSYRPPSRR